MRNSEKLALENGHLRNRIEELEELLECKDIAHIHELRLMQKHIEALMNKYCLN